MAKYEWTPERDEYLRAHFTKQSDSTMAEQLGTSRTAVQFRRYELNLKRRQWTPEQEAFLEEKWGALSMEALTKRLGKSRNAIKVRANRLGLGAFLLSGDYITLNQLSRALGMGSIDGYKDISWTENRGFPVRMQKRDKQHIKVVDLDDFWKWAEANKNMLDFSLMEENALGKEPPWAKEKRRFDFAQHRIHQTTPWTPQEDSRLRSLLAERKYTYLELCKLLRRSSGAIQRRIQDLKLGIHPVRAPKQSKWTQEQYGQFADLIKQGCGYPLMAEILGKSDKALRGRTWDVYRTENLDTVRAYIGDGTWGDGSQPKLVKDCRKYKYVKEPITRLCELLLMRRNELAFDGYWQKDMCMNWDPVKGCLAKAENCDSCGGNFRRIPPQFCVRCGATFYERQESRVCKPCRVARKRQAQRKFAVRAGRAGKAADYFEEGTG